MKVTALKNYTKIVLILFDRFVKVLFLFIASQITGEISSKEEIAAISYILLGASLLSIGNDTNYLKKLHLNSINISDICANRLIIFPFVIFYLIIFYDLNNIFIVISIFLYVFEIYEIDAKENNKILLILLKSIFFIFPLGFYFLTKNQSILIMTHSISNLIYIFYYYKNIFILKKSNLRLFFSIIDFRLVIIAIIALSLGRVELIFGSEFTDQELVKIYKFNRLSEILNFICGFLLYVNSKIIFKWIENNINLIKMATFLLIFLLFTILIIEESIVYSIAITYFFYLLLGGIISYIWIAYSKTNYALIGTILWAVIIFIIHINKGEDIMAYIKWIYFIPIFFSFIGIVMIKKYEKK